MLVPSSWEALSVLKGLQISYRNVWMTSQIKIAERGWNCKPWMHFALIPGIIKDSVDLLRLQTQMHQLIMRCLSYQHPIMSCQAETSLGCIRRCFQQSCSCINATVRVVGEASSGTACTIPIPGAQKWWIQMETGRSPDQGSIKLLCRSRLQMWLLLPGKERWTGWCL